MTGMTCVWRLSERVSLLRSLRTYLGVLRREISLNMPFYSELLESAADDSVKPIARKAAELIKSGKTPAESVCEAFSQPYAVRLLTAEEREYMAGVIADLGESDCESAARRLGAAEKTLDEFVSQAAAQRTQRSRVQLALAVYLGLALVILLM